MGAYLVNICVYIGRRLIDQIIVCIVIAKPKRWWGHDFSVSFLLLLLCCFVHRVEGSPATAEAASTVAVHADNGPRVCSTACQLASCRIVSRSSTIRFGTREEEEVGFRNIAEILRLVHVQHGICLRSASSRGWHPEPIVKGALMRQPKLC